MPRELARDDHLEGVADDQHQPEDDVEGELDPPVARRPQALGQSEGDGHRRAPADDLGQAQHGEIRRDPPRCGLPGESSLGRCAGRGRDNPLANEAGLELRDGHARSHFPVIRTASISPIRSARPRPACTARSPAGATFRRGCAPSAEGCRFRPGQWHMRASDDGSLFASSKDGGGRRGRTVVAPSVAVNREFGLPRPLS